MGHRIEIHGGLLQVVAHHLDSSVHDHQSVVAGFAMRSLPVGTAYGIWVGVGAVGTVILGIILLGEPANATRLVSVALIIAGIVGLKISTPA